MAQRRDWSFKKAVLTIAGTSLAMWTINRVLDHSKNTGTEPTITPAVAEEKATTPEPAGKHEPSSYEKNSPWLARVLVNIGRWSLYMAMACWVVLSTLIVFGCASAAKNDWFQNVFAWELGYASAIGISFILTFVSTHTWRDVKALRTDSKPWMQKTLTGCIALLVITVPTATAILWYRSVFVPPEGTTKVSLMALGVLLGGEFTPRWLATIFSQRR